MHVINIKLHLTFPSCKNPKADRPCVKAEKNENINEMIPSKDKMRNSVTSVLNVSKTHFKLHAFESIEAELRANITQWKGRGNIFYWLVSPLRPLKRVRKIELFCFDGMERESNLLHNNWRQTWPQDLSLLGLRLRSKSRLKKNSWFFWEMFEFWDKVGICAQMVNRRLGFTQSSHDINEQFNSIQKQLISWPTHP